MQPRNAFVVQLVAVASLVAFAETQGCAAGTDDAPTGPVASASDTTAGPTSTHAGSTTTSGVTSSSAGGAGATATSTATSTSTSTATATSTSTSTSTSTATASTTSGAGGCGTVYDHTITIDGTNDFNAGETFTTTSASYTGYVSWDANNIYVGMSGADIASGDVNRWVLVYIGGPAGTSMGQTYNTQHPTLPFQAEWHLRWRADNTFTNAQHWNGTAWVDAMWTFTGLVFKQGQYLEMAIPRANVGSPTGTVDLHIDMLNETTNTEGTYAGVPSGSFTDGYNPSFTKYFAFDLAGCTTPLSYTPL